MDTPETEQLTQMLRSMGQSTPIATSNANATRKAIKEEMQKKKKKALKPTVADEGEKDGKVR